MRAPTRWVEPGVQLKDLLVCFDGTLIYRQKLLFYNQVASGRYGNCSITRGDYAWAAAVVAMRVGRKGMRPVWAMRSLRESQKETPSLRQVFFKLMKVSRHCLPSSLRVPPLTLRFFTQSRISRSLALGC